MARNFQEVDLGDLTPLAQALPELSNGWTGWPTLTGKRGGPKRGQRITNQQDFGVPKGPASFGVAISSAVFVASVADVRKELERYASFEDKSKQAKTIGAIAKNWSKEYRGATGVERDPLAPD